MGEARRIEANARAAALARHHLCIFCGGARAAEEGDHCPPRGVFLTRSWPEGYCFPACSHCNRSSRDHEAWIAFISRLDPNGLPESAQQDQTFAKFLRHMRKNNPDVLLRMKMSVQKKRAIARGGVIQLQPGQIYKDMPLIAVPIECKIAVNQFSKKLAKALHFHHTGKIVPSDAGIATKWYTNINRMKGDVPEEIFNLPSGTAKIIRGKVDLSPQFNYRFETSSDGMMSVFTAWFRFSVCIFMLVTFDANLLNPETGTDSPT